MKLFYFTSERFGLEAIRNSRLKIARINELNDPFEFLGLNLQREDRKKMKNWKAGMADKYGLICMSSNWQNPLLWGHYADKHKGLCLGFSVADDGSFKRVEYTSSRPELRDIGRDRIEDLNEDDMQKMLFTKFEAWSYEAEYRVFTTLSEKDEASGLYFLSFSNNMKLTQVIVGERSSLTRKKLATVLGNRISEVTSFKARAGFKKFKVVENKLKSAWK